MSEHESLILALDRPSSTDADHRQSPTSVSEPAPEYAFTMKLERIESSPPTFVQEKEDARPYPRFALLKFLFPKA